MNALKPVSAMAVILASAAVTFYSFGPPCAGDIGGQTVDEWAIPADAQAKAVQALKALGPDRGAKKITSRVIDITGGSRDVKASRIEVLKALKDLNAKETGTEILIELSGDVLFDFDKADIRADAIESLKKVATVIKAYPNSKGTIAGHTDSKGDDAYNQKLSERRAESVKDWLVKNGGVDAKLLATVGYGETKPAASNTKPDGSDDPAGRQKNRRVEIVIKKQ